MMFAQMWFMAGRKVSPAKEAERTQLAKGLSHLSAVLQSIGIPPLNYVGH